MTSPLNPLASNDLLDGVRLVRSVANEFHIRVHLIMALSHEGNYRFKRLAGFGVFAFGTNRFKLVNKDGQLILIEGRVAIFVDESQTASVLDFVRIIHVLPRVEQRRTVFQDVAPFSLPEDV